MIKLKKSILPENHTKNDFKCFGPIATKDGQFEDTMLTDLGCFQQGKIDSNKWYNACVVQSKLNNDWYVYVEYGRTGSTTKPQFQFVKFTSKDEAQTYYIKQMHAKNDKRGMWVNHPVLGKILQPKPKKDCYLVRPLTTRNVGLPDASNITIPTTNKISHNSQQFDQQSEQLLQDLNIGTLQYTRSSMESGILPTLETVEECRLICDEATKINNKLEYTANILASNDIMDLTRLIYSRIPKKKNKKSYKEEWLLTPNNVYSWQQDLDAFENALKSQQTNIVTEKYPFIIEYVSLHSTIGTFIEQWFKKATQNKHSYLNKPLHIKHLWKITKENDWARFLSCQNKVFTDNNDKPLHQPVRIDLNNAEKEMFERSGTWLLFHGTRSVNVGGILRESFRLPKTLSSVSINGAMWGSNSLYFADDWKKSAGYCSLKDSYWARGKGTITNRNAFIFICDVMLGKMFIPRTRCTQLPGGYHSIFAKSGISSVINNEFVISKTEQAHLRYLIEFNI